MSYVPRLVCPEDGNKYYNRKSNGGYSTCIQGNTKMECYNPKLDTLPNCVGYAMGRYNEVGDYKEFKYTFKGNAEDWFAYAKTIGLKTGTTPKLGAVICWKKGRAGTGSDGAGHVAIVEQIIDKTTIVTSESGWSSNKRLFWTQRREKGNGNWGQPTGYTFQGFIYNPAVDDNPKNYLSYGDKGEDVKQLQVDLNKFGWYDLKLDGSFGSATKKAVEDMQKKLSLTVDGIYGPKSKEALTKANTDPKGSTELDVLVDGKQRQIRAINVDGYNFIELWDLYYKLNVAEVSYNSKKKMPEIKTK